METSLVTQLKESQASNGQRASRKPRAISEQVVVLVGASSGIGRETALRLGLRGAKLVLAARNEIALRSVVDEIQQAGGEARAIVTDVAEPAQLQHLADAAIQLYGRVDTWINDAAISEYAMFEEMTAEEVERIVRVNLLGTIHGCRAILPHMRRQGYGMIMNVGSIVSIRGLPLQSIYSATKFGIRGFTESLRVELEHEQSGIVVTLVMPPSTNTPFFNHARSKMGVKPQPIPPIYDVPIVAHAIVYAMEHPQRDVLIGGASKFIEVLQRISPRLVDLFLLQGGRGFKGQQTNQPDDGADTMFQPSYESGRTHGDFTSRAKKISLYTPLELRPGVKAAVVGSLLAGVAWTATRYLRSRS